MSLSMLIAVLFIIFSFILFFSPFHGVALASLSLIGIFLAFLSFSLFLVALFFPLYCSKLISKTAKMVPHVLQLLKKNSFFYWGTSALQIISATALFASFELLFLGVIPLRWLLGGYLICMGVSFALLSRLNILVSNYLDPFNMIEIIEKEVQKNASNEKAKEFCGWLAALTEIITKSLKKGQTALASEALQKTISAASHFFTGKNSQSIDSQSYIIFYLLNRLDQCQAIAISEKFEFFVTELLSQSGKLVLFAGKQDPLLATIPLQFLGKWIKRSLHAGFDSIGIKSSCLLVEIAKELIQNAKNSNENLHEPLQGIALNLADIARESFKRDKTSSIPALMRPISDFQAIIKGAPEQIPNRIAVETTTQNIIQEFEALQAIMRTIPPERETTEK